MLTLRLSDSAALLLSPISPFVRLKSSPILLLKCGAWAQLKQPSRPALVPNVLFEMLNSCSCGGTHFARSM